MSIAGNSYRALSCNLDIGGSGLEVVVKDCIDVEGVPTVCGSAALLDAPPASKHSDVVSQLIANDCKIVGKANMHELAYGVTGINSVFGTPINPRWPDRIPGGSSSGCAVAVAAGMCDFAIGTDTGGSVRQPAVCCGVYGIKPTFGRISRNGCYPVNTTLDCVGVFARSVALLCQGLEAVDPTFVAETLADSPRLARTTTGFSYAVDPLISAFVESLPNTFSADLPLISEAFDAGLTVIGAEAVEAYGNLIQDGKPIGADVLQRLTQARHINRDTLRKAEEVRKAFTHEVDQLLTDCEALITPALPCVPPTLEQVNNATSVLHLTQFLRPFNVSGHPAIVLPISIGDAGLPAGIQIVGKKGEDSRLCAIAQWMVTTLTVFNDNEEN